MEQNLARLAGGRIDVGEFTAGKIRGQGAGKPFLRAAGTNDE
jgi:hypothetical protein